MKYRDTIVPHKVENYNLAVEGDMSPLLEKID
jgi:hypothetical protein